MRSAGVGADSNKQRSTTDPRAGGVRREGRPELHTSWRTMPAAANGRGHVRGSPLPAGGRQVPCDVDRPRGGANGFGTVQQPANATKRPPTRQSVAEILSRPTEMAKIQLAKARFTRRKGSFRYHLPWRGYQGNQSCCDIYRSRRALRWCWDGIVNLAGAIRNSRRYLSFVWQDAQCNACCTSCRLSQCCEISFRFAVS